MQLERSCSRQNQECLRECPNPLKGLKRRSIRTWELRKHEPSQRARTPIGCRSRPRGIQAIFFFGRVQNPRSKIRCAKGKGGDAGSRGRSPAKVLKYRQEPSNSTVQPTRLIRFGPVFPMESEHNCSGELMELSLSALR